LPAIGQPALVVGGVVGTPVDGRGDFDGFVFTAKAGDLVRIQLTAVGASSVGAAQACLELAAAHVKTMKEQGRSSQALEFKLADMAGKLMEARLALQTASVLLDSKHPASIGHCAIAKKTATDNGFFVCNEALAIFGESQSPERQAVERFMRGTRVHSIVEGTNEIMRFIIGKQLVA
jgi:alkylation response protein AidB-like acyl-CoA dehydrogenase